jgi:hypothetical protein
MLRGGRKNYCCGHQQFCPQWPSPYLIELKVPGPTTSKVVASGASILKQLKSISFFFKKKFIKK